MFFSSETQFGRHFSLRNLFEFKFSHVSRQIYHLKHGLVGTLYRVANWSFMNGRQRQFKNLKCSLPDTNCCWQAHVQHLCSINVKYN